MDKRLHRVKWGSGNPRLRTSIVNWKEPLRWERQHKEFFAEYGRRQRVFCASLADVFDNEVPQAWREDLWALIRETRNLDWIIITKRIGNARKMLPADWGDGYRNVFLLSTVCNQDEADRDIPKLVETPARRRGIIAEPLLGMIDLTCIPWPASHKRVTDDISDGYHALQFIGDIPTLDLVICGGASDQPAIPDYEPPPMHPAWARSLRDQCVAAGVSFFFKQNGEWVSVSEVEGEGPHYTFPDGATVRRIGKKAAGRTLDGRTWDEYPELDAI